MTVPRPRGRSVKEEIADKLRQQILSGSLGPEDKLPTQLDLADEYGVARNTARDALGILVNEGLIVARRPYGHFVRGRQRMQYRPQSDLIQRPGDALKDVFLTEQELAGRRPTQTIDVAIVQPPREVAERMDLSDGEDVVVRRRVRYLEGEPFLTNDSYFLRPIVEGTEIMSPHDIARGANIVLAEQGHRQVRATDEFTSRMPTPAEQHRLELTPGTPVVHQLTTGYDASGRVVRVVVSTLPGDRHVIVIERPGLPDVDEPS